MTSYNHIHRKLILYRLCRLLLHFHFLSPPSNEEPVKTTWTLLTSPDRSSSCFYSSEPCSFACALLFTEFDLYQYFILKTLLKHFYFSKSCSFACMLLFVEFLIYIILKTLRDLLISHHLEMLVIVFSLFLYNPATNIDPLQ